MSFTFDEPIEPSFTFHLETTTPFISESPFGSLLYDFMLLVSAGLVVNYFWDLVFTPPLEKKLAKVIEIQDHLSEALSRTRIERDALAEENQSLTSKFSRKVTAVKLLAGRVVNLTKRCEELKELVFRRLASRYHPGQVVQKLEELKAQKMAVYVSTNGDTELSKGKAIAYACSAVADAILKNKEAERWTRGGSKLVVLEGRDSVYLQEKVELADKLNLPIEITRGDGGNDPIVLVIGPERASLVNKVSNRDKLLA